MRRTRLAGFLALTVAATALSAHADPAGEKLAAAKALAEKRWKDVLIVRHIGSAHLSRILPKSDIFCVEVPNPRSQIAGRPTFLHTLVMRPEGNTYVESDEAACQVLSKSGAKPVDVVDALNTSLGFGELRNYVLQMPVAPQVHPNSWDVVVKPEKNGWTVTCVFMTDPNGGPRGRCDRYEMSISRDGNISAKALETLIRALYD